MCLELKTMLKTKEATEEEHLSTEVKFVNNTGKVQCFSALYHTVCLFRGMCFDVNAQILKCMMVLRSERAEMSLARHTSDLKVYAL